MIDTIRNADLNDMVALLRDQRTRALDVVAACHNIRSEGGSLVIKGTEPIITSDGVDMAEGTYFPTGVADEGIASKLGIPIGYLRKLRNEPRPDLYDANVNGWLRGDSRKFLLRCLRKPDGSELGGSGVLRAFLSDSYRVIDNLDVLLAGLAGMQRAGLDTSDLTITGDLTERRMYLRVTSAAVVARASTLLERYRSPFGGMLGRDNPIVNGGFVMKNSEVGGGRYSIVPRFVVQVCSNGMTVEEDGMHEVHLGGKLEQGNINWSDATRAKNIELITSQTADAVASFLNPEYVQARIDAMEAVAGKPVTDAPTVIKNVSKSLNFTEGQQASILDYFIQGADSTAGGVMQAVTAAAVAEPDGDVAADLERKAFSALELAAR